MNWLNAHASAIQALASVATLGVTVVLAVLTGRYVRLTKSIADTAWQQMQYVKLAATTARKQTAVSLEALSKRLRVPLASLDPNVPKPKQVREYSLLSQQDISDLETLARDVSDDATRFAGKAAVSPRRILGVIDEAKPVNPTLGWRPSDTQIGVWKEAMDAGPKMLEELEKACRQVAVA